MARHPLLDLRPRRLLLVAAVAAVQVLGTLAAGRRGASPDAFPGQGPDDEARRWEEWADWQAGRERVDALAVLLLLAGPAFLLLRRRPLTTAVGAVGAAGLYVAAGYVVGPVLLAAAVALVQAVAAGTRVQAWVVAAGGWALAVLGSWLGPHPLRLTTGLGFVVWVVAVLAIADVVRGRRERAAAERRVVEEQRRAQEEERRRQVSEERLQIARDLHDGVAHQISLISVRAGVAVHLLEGGGEAAPQEAREALVTIRQASSEALAELRSALGALRSEGEAAPRHPVPGLLAGGAALVGRWREAGLAVTLHGLAAQPATTPPPPRTAVPTAVDQAAYRVVQESLTNVSRHSRAAAVDVRWSVAGSSAGGPGEAVLTVTDPGPRRGDGSGGGRGVVGMRERVQLLGGTFTAGPHGEGWQVRAGFPLQREEAP